MFKKLRLVGFTLILFFLLTTSALGKTVSQSKVVVIVLNATSLNEINDSNTPNIDSLLAQKKLSIGLANSRPGKGAITETSGFLSIGSGAKANGGILGMLAFELKEEFLYKQKKYLAGSFYRKNTGFSTSPNEIVNLSVVDTSRISTAYDYDVLPGLLGSTLKRGGIKRAVVGNGDSVDGYHREATLIAMDTAGKIDEGSVEGVFSDQRLLKESKKALRQSRFVVIDYGRTARLDYSRLFVTDKNYLKQKKKAISDADSLIGKIVSFLDLKKDLVVVVSPTPSWSQIQEKNLLTPIMLISANQKSNTYALSTRWVGLVNDIDIAPTILKHFSIKKPYQMSGSPIESKNVSQNPVKYLIEEENKAVVNNLARLPLLTTYITAIIIVIVLSFLLLFVNKVSSRTYSMMQGLLFFLVSAPIAFIIFGLLGPTNIYFIFAGTLLFSAALAVFAMLAKNHYKSMLVLFLATSILIVVDIIFGSLMMRDSVFGFSPISGARFYGIGNEYMGVLIGSSILSFSLIRDIYGFKSKNFIYFMVAAFVFLTLMIGFPGIGSNIGGALAASVAFAFAVFYLSGAGFSWKQFYILIGCLFVVLAVIFLSDKLFGIQTHAGKTGELIASGGLGEVVLIFKRKILANFALVRYTSWTKVLITILAVFPILFIRPPDAVKKLREKLPNVWAGAIGVGFGSIAAFVFNDSGVVAAATCLMYAAVLVLYVIIDEQKRLIV